MTVTEFRKSASIWWSYGHWPNYSRLFFQDTVYGETIALLTWKREQYISEHYIMNLSSPFTPAYWLPYCLSRPFPGISDNFLGSWNPWLQRHPQWQAVSRTVRVRTAAHWSERDMIHCGPVPSFYPVFWLLLSGNAFTRKQHHMRKSSVNTIPEFYLIFSRKIFFPIFFFWGGEGASAPSPSPTPINNTDRSRLYHFACTLMI